MTGQGSAFYAHERTRTDDARNHAKIMANSKLGACGIWEFIPVNAENFAAHWSPSPSVPLRDSGPACKANARNSSWACSAKPGEDEVGTTTIEITTVTTKGRDIVLVQRMQYEQAQYIIYSSRFSFTIYLSQTSLRQVPGFPADPRAAAPSSRVHNGEYVHPVLLGLWQVHFSKTPGDPNRVKRLQLDISCGW